MRKFTILIFFIYFNATAQPTSFDEYDHSSDVHYIYNSNKHIDWIQLSIHNYSGAVLKSDDGKDSFGNQFFTYTYELYNNNDELIHQKEISPADYLWKDNGSVNYFETFDISSNMGDSFYSKIKITSYVQYGYPDFISYFRTIVAEYTSLTIKYSIDSDKDKDNVNDSEDNCPNNYNPNQEDSDGDGIGDICDTPDGFADLFLDKAQTIIFSDDVTIPPVLSQIGSKKYLIRYETGSIRIAASIIQNKGETNSSPTNITYCFSTDTSLNYSANSSNNYDTKINVTTSLPSINAKGFKEVNDVVINGYALSTNNREPTAGNYYILVVLDFDKKVPEGDNEDNNITAIPIKYERVARKTPPKKPCPPYCLQDPLPWQEPYQVNVYNFSGMKVNSATVKNEEEEKELVNSLPSGTQYIIKTKNEDKKIRK